MTTQVALVVPRRSVRYWLLSQWCGPHQLPTTRCGVWGAIGAWVGSVVFALAVVAAFALWFLLPVGRNVLFQFSQRPVAFLLQEVAYFVGNFALLYYVLPKADEWCTARSRRIKNAVRVRFGLVRQALCRPVVYR
ncbi:hypothetical protein HYZ80_00230 [Candidatus Parcubacteria bacterium]|nr:hypothetical protein [Candidatus Parcubacteria bacterium]